MAGQSIRRPENIAKLTKTSGTTLQLPASVVNVGALQYSTSTLTLNTAVVGVGGMDVAGGIVSSSLYYVYCVVSSGNVALIASLSATGPSGFAQYRSVGAFNTDVSSQIVIVEPALDACQTVTSDVSIPTNMTTSQATALGLKQYLHGTTYNGGNAPTVTLSSSGSITSLARAVFIPYQMQGGEWRLRFSINAAVSSASRTSAAFAINGVTTKNTAGYYQSITVWQDGASGYTATAYMDVNSNAILTYHASATTIGYRISGDIELESKPTWAY